MDGSDEEAANEDMMKHNSNINKPTILYLPLPHFMPTTPFLTCFPTTFHVFPMPFEPYFKLHIFVPDPIGSSCFPQDLGNTVMFHNTCPIFCNHSATFTTAEIPGHQVPCSNLIIVNS